MKRILSVLMVLAILITLAACGKKDNDSGVMDFEAESPDLNFDVQEYEASDNKIEFDIETPELDFEVEEYEAYTNKIEFEIEPFEFDFKIEPYVAPSTKIEFEIEEFELNNIDNFDVTDAAKIGDMTDDQKKIIVTTKQSLLHNLALAFKQSGISVAINETSGEISLDSSVLFGGDSAELTSEGKDFLKKFITVYSTVVFSEEFDGFISKILVEGHTAPVPGGTYENSLPLSEKRANNVKAYCVSSETGISADMTAKLQSVLEAVGLSNSKPVKDEAGEIDMAASRRVTFRFLINLDE